MDSTNFVVAAYAITGLVLALYTWSVLSRLSRARKSARGDRPAGGRDPSSN